MKCIEMYCIVLHRIVLYCLEPFLDDHDSNYHYYKGIYLYVVSGTIITCYWYQSLIIAINRYDSSL